MGIDRNDGDSLPPEREWCVCVAVSVLEHVPRDVLTAWMAVESFANAKGECWASNRALARRMNMGPITSAQRALLKLEEFGIVRRHDLDNNRRTLILLRRTSDPIGGAEWAALLERGELRREIRTADHSKKHNQ